MERQQRYLEIGRFVFQMYRRAARRAVARAVEDGRLSHPSELCCHDCGAPAIGYDHRYYDEPLTVEPVCNRCNLTRGMAELRLTRIDRDLSPYWGFGSMNVSEYQKLMGEEPYTDQGV